MPGDPFDIDLPHTPLSRAALTVARPLLESVLELNALRAIYGQVLEQRSGSFAARALNALDISTVVSEADLAKIPSHGPVVVAANHPHGALDGLLLASVLERARPDFKLLANRLLARVPELNDLCVFVDPFGGSKAAARSRTGLRQAYDWLNDGHVLIVFPAGEVAHIRTSDDTREDSPWADTFARLALATNASVVPAFIAGSNSSLFYGAGRLHRLLRTALLPRELVRSRGRRVHVRVGTSIQGHPSQREDSERHLAALARTAVDRLRADDNRGQSAVLPGFTDAEIACEVQNLPPCTRLVVSGRFTVYCAEAPLIPRTLDEIGRLRELTYRAIGEGTGRGRDLDHFDAYYTHLFVWDHKARRLVGAYRIGNVASIVRELGVEGLYTRQLFRYDRRFVDSLGPALELGRSWVRAEYQRHSNALLMLWRGIGRFVVERSRARVLFGPVSISARYAHATHGLLQAFLEQNHRHDALADLVEGMNPPPGARASSNSTPGPGVIPRTVDEADALVSRLEADGKGVPVLLRQYLKLNARMIGFNVDPDFGDALDALMMVDLADVDPAVLTRYLGLHAAREIGRSPLAA